MKPRMLATAQSNIARDESGQALTEYILLLLVVMSAFFAIQGVITQSGFGDKWSKALTNNFAHAYQYGRPDALGFDDPGGPKNHPRIPENGSLRLFINPAK